MLINKSLLGGTLFKQFIDGWLVSWESKGNHRHWASLQKPNFNREILIVMQNPGSLSGDGSNLKRDLTLRVLRKFGDAIQANLVIVNLFDFASPKPRDLHKNWETRDAEHLVYSQLLKNKYQGILFAYGNPEKTLLADYLERINHVRTVFKAIPEIVGPKTKDGNPVHPANWQRHKLLPIVIDATKIRLES